VPPIWPRVQGVFPRSAQRGTEDSITLAGRNLQGGNGLLFTSAIITARIVHSTPLEVKAVVSVKPDAEPGRHDLRLLAGHGSALAYFDVGTVPERNEKDPNSSASQVEALQMPLLINGVIPSGDYDYFRFDAAAGETLTFDLQATRLGASTDAVLSVLNEAGEEIAYSDD